MERRNLESVFDSTPPLRLLAKLSIPSVLTTMIMLLYNLADTFFVGQTGDRLQVAAVALCAPVFSLISGIGMLFGNGGSIRCSILLGEGKTDCVKSVFSFCCWSTLVTGAMLAVGMLFARQPLLEQSDVVILHCPLNDSTRGMIDKAALESMSLRAQIVFENLRCWLKGEPVNVVK